jgi:N-acetylglucosaminyldiphosphoundecaprenol N-acetyl-beta-D-mannosaminyltransferase
MGQTNTVEVLGVAISRLGMSDAIQACEQHLDRGHGGYVCFANVHSVTESTSNPDLHAALNGAFLSVADGMPLVWTSRLKDQPIETRVCGPDFTAEWLKKHAQSLQGFIGGALLSREG